ncbi:nuclear transport factor 2 family protein [Spirosoma pollinicola]|uniref:SnoaL-like domain-containing protein n=1 Tax=Spirosoma pollinicola TaxID=2057025 RepID=A0A2K8YT40_9BACT|nr:nuclear transport factor 2 family protein [Spirosoma pollinicola]AUD00802.1 hypothetical protein CWM47_02600 [Spirosoma pollinicola]
MKKLILLGCAAMLFNITNGQQQPTVSKQEQAAIQQVILDSKAAFDKRNLNTFFNYFIKSQALYYQVYEASGQLILAHGYPAMSHMVGSYVKEHPQPSKGKYAQLDPRVHVNGNTAWVSATGEMDMGGEKTSSRDFFVLEKQGSQWKISAIIVQDYAKGKLIVVK